MEVVSYTERDVDAKDCRWLAFSFTSGHWRPAKGVFQERSKWN
jgi:hypothetical protein